MTTSQTPEYRWGCPDDPEACNRVRTRLSGYTLVAPTLPEILPKASTVRTSGSSLDVDLRYASLSASNVLMSIAEYLQRRRSRSNGEIKARKPTGKHPSDRS